MKVKAKILSALCSLPEAQLCDHLKVVRPNLKDCGNYLYSESPKNKVLAVAHMDVAQGVSTSASFRVVKDDSTSVILHPTLDDRLGVFTILYLLPQYNIATDILLTTDEESCMSTARDFAEVCNKDYNWIVELDRAGEDVVLYEYRDDVALVSDLESVGFKLGVGSYSDICEMDELGVSAFNMGIGYHFQHTSQCCAVLPQLARQLAKLKVFYDKFKDKAYEHEYVPRGIYYPSARDFSDDTRLYEGWGDDDEKRWDEQYGEEGSGTYWQGGQMHWSYVQPRKKAYGEHRGKRLWAGHWGDEADY